MEFKKSHALDILCEQLISCVDIQIGVFLLAYGNEVTARA